MFPLGKEEDYYPAILKASIILLVVVIAMWLAVSWIRKRLKQDDATGGTGFTLSDLRQLHKQGKMTAEEYEKAKAILLAEMGKPAAKPANEQKPSGE